MIRADRVQRPYASVHLPPGATSSAGADEDIAYGKLPLRDRMATGPTLTLHLKNMERWVPRLTWPPEYFDWKRIFMACANITRLNRNEDTYWQAITTTIHSRYYSKVDQMRLDGLTIEEFFERFPEEMGVTPEIIIDAFGRINRRGRAVVQLLEDEAARYRAVADLVKD
eukprot:Lankesteria_metandrocarpae@DN804_c0_g1_i1.p1